MRQDAEDDDPVGFPSAALRDEHRAGLPNAFNRLERRKSAIVTTPGSGKVFELKRLHEKDIVVFGGARFAHSLIEHRLIDEYRLTVHPVILGEGLSLMHGLPEPQRLGLVSSTAYADGCVTQVYVPR